MIKPSHIDVRAVYTFYCIQVREGDGGLHHREGAVHEVDLGNHAGPAEVGASPDRFDVVDDFDHVPGLHGAKAAVQFLGGVFAEFDLRDRAELGEGDLLFEAFEGREGHELLRPLDPVHLRFRFFAHVTPGDLRSGRCARGCGPRR